MTLIETLTLTLPWYFSFYLSTVYYLQQVDVTYSTFLYDTFYLYAMVVNHTIEQGGNPYDGVTIFQNTKLQHFKGKNRSDIMRCFHRHRISSESARKDQLRIIIILNKPETNIILPTNRSILDNNTIDCIFTKIARICKPSNVGFSHNWYETIPGISLNFKSWWPNPKPSPKQTIINSPTN